MRVRVERPTEPAPRVGVPTEAALDHPAVEEERGVAGAEAQGPLRPVARLAATAVARERPRQYVVAGDRGPADVGEAGELERLGEANATVCAVERGLQVDPRAVRRLDLLDRGDEVVLVAAPPASGRSRPTGRRAGQRSRGAEPLRRRVAGARPHGRAFPARPRIGPAHRVRVRNRDERRARAGRRTRRELHGRPTSAAFRARPTSTRTPRDDRPRRRGRAPSRRSLPPRRRGAPARRRRVHKKRCWASARPSGRTLQTLRRSGRARAAHRRGRRAVQLCPVPRQAPGGRARARPESGGG